MKKLIVMSMTLFFFFGCSQKKSEIVVDNSQVPTDFVPEHIRLSHIEVVKH